MLDPDLADPAVIVAALIGLLLFAGLYVTVQVVNIRNHVQTFERTLDRKEKEKQ